MCSVFFSAVIFIPDCSRVASHDESVFNTGDDLDDLPTELHRSSYSSGRCASLISSRLYLTRTERSTSCTCTVNAPAPVLCPDFNVLIIIGRMVRYRYRDLDLGCRFLGRPSACISQLMSFRSPPRADKHGCSCGV